MFKKNSIPVTLSLAIILLIMYILNSLNHNEFVKFFVLKQSLVNFYPWQLITYVFYDNMSFFYYIFKIMIIFWFCSVLESTWGTKHFSIFLAFTILTKSVVTLIINYFFHSLPLEWLLNGFDSLLNPNSFTLSLMTAFGFIYAEERIYLFFVIPVKVKYLSIFSLLVVLVHTIQIFISGNSIQFNLAIALIYLSGFTGLLVYSKRVFGFTLFNFNNFKVGHIYPQKKVFKENEKLLAGKEKIHNTIQTTNELPLCDEADFDESDPYCKGCDRMHRCVIRKNKNNAD